MRSDRFLRKINLIDETPSGNAGTVFVCWWVSVNVGCLFSDKLRGAFVLGHGLHDAAHFPFLFLKAATEKGHEYFHEHFAVVHGTVHFFFVDGHRDFTALHKHVRHEAELVVCKFRHDCFGNGETVNDGVAGGELRILFVGGTQEACIEVCVVS